MMLILRSLLVSCTCLGLAVSSATAVAPSAAAPVATSTRLAKADSQLLDQVLSSEGTTVTLWARYVSSRDRTFVKAAIRRKNSGAWTGRVTLASWKGFVLPHGSLAPAAGGRVLATWANASGQLILRRWDPSSGWQRRVLVPGAAANTHAPTVAVNAAAGIRAIAYVRGRPDAETSVLRVAVQRNGVWTTRSVGAAGDPYFLNRPSLVIDDDQNLTVAWREFAFPYGDVNGFASRLASDADSWEPPQDLGYLGEPQDTVEPVLTVDGSGLVTLYQSSEYSDGVNPVQVWQRAGAEDWLNVGSIPGSIGTDWLRVRTNSRGDVVAVAHGVFVKPAGGAWTYVDGSSSWSTAQISLSESGRIAAVGLVGSGQRQLAVRYGEVSGSFEEPVTLTSGSGQRGAVAATLAPNGSLGIVWSNRRPHPRRYLLNTIVEQLPA